MYSGCLSMLCECGKFEKHSVEHWRVGVVSDFPRSPCLYASRVLTLAFSCHPFRSVFCVLKHQVIEIPCPRILPLGICLCKYTGIFPSILECFAFLWPHRLVQDEMRDSILVWMLAILTVREEVFILICKCLGAHSFFKIVL